MPPTIKTLTSPNTPRPIGPYSHIAKAEQFVAISATAGLIGQLVGEDVASQTKQIFELFRTMLEPAGSDLNSRPSR